MKKEEWEEKGYDRPPTGTYTPICEKAEVGDGYELVRSDAKETAEQEMLDTDGCWKQIHVKLVISPRTYLRRQPLRVSHAVNRATAAGKEGDDEHTRLMLFFFGCGPSDASRLPPSPRELGSSWDELADA